MAPLTTNSQQEKDNLLTSRDSIDDASVRQSLDSVSTASSTSLVLENLNSLAESTKKPSKPLEPLEYRDDNSDPELPRWREDKNVGQRMSKQLKRVIWIISVVAVIGWVLALVAFLVGGRYKHSSTLPYDHEAPAKSSGKQLTMAQIQSGQYYPSFAQITWTAGPEGEDGLLLEANQPGKDFLVVEDIRSRKGDPNAHPSRTLLKQGWVHTPHGQTYVDDFWPSPDFKKVLVATDKKTVYRHSFTAIYYIVDVATQKAEPLDPLHAVERVQLARWAPTSESIIFTRNNNLYLRLVASTAVRQITSDGGPEYFYGVPDWVYEEEVLQNNVGTWWDREGRFVATMRTNETLVPEYPVQFFLSRPSETQPEPGLERYPEVSKIKYPKVGAPNPFVDLMFYDLSRNEIFAVDIDGQFADDDRILADVIWAVDGKCLVRQLNRESDIIRMILIDVPKQTGKVVRSIDIKTLDAGWVEPGQTARYIPADPANGRPQDGYLDMIIHDDNDHLAYFTPMDAEEPIRLTSGQWSIEHGSYWIDLDHNLLYFVAAKQSPGERHLYQVSLLTGGEVTPLVPIDKPAYYEASFSEKAGYALVTLHGPGIPTQEVVSTPANSVQYEEVLAQNKELAQIAAQHELPSKIFGTIEVDGYTLHTMELRPRHFDPKKRYPLLFYQYSGPGSQQVNRRWNVDFQSYVAATLGYIVVTVDPRGTGFIGRKAQCITRGHLGKYEAHDQIAAAKIWSQKPYIDADRIAIWGWSFGGYTTLKVLEVDAGQTFKYGIAVAPVTDWRFYDSIYTERYMFTSQHNPEGYERSAINNVTALSRNVRFMMMHGIADDNVHMQNTLTLIDKLDLGGITNYDVHVFPDSNHNIFFHNANHIVYEKIEKWLISAFNGMWYKYENPKPEEIGQG